MKDWKNELDKALDSKSRIRKAMTVAQFWACETEMDSDYLQSCVDRALLIESQLDD